MLSAFPQNIHEKLNHYIYLYIDPHDNQIFYVGKGVRNRAFDHLNDRSETAKTERISDIRENGLEPRIEILVHGLQTDEIARKVEASIIDLIGIDNLTNIQNGYESREFGRMTLEQIVATYSAETAEISEPAILININRSFRFGMTDVELYDATRSAWIVGPRKDLARYAFATYHGIIQEVYQIVQWLPGGSTLNTAHPGDREVDQSRWEFVGRVAESSIRNKYRYKQLPAAPASQNPIRYLNC